MKSGDGKYIYYNGDYYEGNFKNDKKEGKGKFVSEGMTLEGVWENDKLIDQF